MNEYALYEGDTFLAIGTATELAEKFDLNPDTVRYYASKKAHKLAEENPNYKVAINLGRVEV